MPNILVRDLSPETVAALKRRAQQHRRSLQQELAAVLEEAASQPEQASAHELAEAIRARLAATGRPFTDSTGLVREDRER